MIDCEVKFGAFVPTIPKIYRDAAADNSSSNKACNLVLPRASECTIGPRWTPLKLRSIHPFNHDTSIFEFELPDPQSYLRLPVTAHLLVKAPGREHNGGGDAVRPYTAISETNPGTFSIMVKRYKEWSTPESKLKTMNRFFLYTKTDHSYKPPGAVSNYVHSLRVGQYLEFRHDSLCLGKISYPFSDRVTAITLIAVGAGVSPMIRILRALLDSKNGDGSGGHVKTVRLLYGVRTVGDILQRERLDRWHEEHSDTGRFRVRYCIGSRWTNVHFGAKTSLKEGPPLPDGWNGVGSDRRELGWVDGDKVERWGASTANDDGHRIFICGLPGVYLALAGPRSDPTVEKGTQLHQLGYRDHQVIKF